MELPRLLVFGHPDHARRLRMTGKVLAELRRRRWPFCAVACGDLPDELIRSTPPDELHSSLTLEEMVNLFLSASVILETADEPRSLSPAYPVGRAAGIPTICHRDAANDGLRVDEWSADAFADALMKLPGSSPADPARVRAAVQKAFAGRV